MIDEILNTLVGATPDVEESDAALKRRITTRLHLMHPVTVLARSRLDDLYGEACAARSTLGDPVVTISATELINLLTEVARARARNGGNAF